MALGLVTGLAEKNDIAAITPNGSTKNSTKSSKPGASSQAIGVGREEAEAMRLYRGRRRCSGPRRRASRALPVTGGAPWHRNCVEAFARATALLRCLLKIRHEIGELAGLLDAVEHHLGVRHLGLGIAHVLGQGRIVPHDTGLVHRLVERNACTLAS